MADTFWRRRAVWLPRYNSNDSAEITRQKWNDMVQRIENELDIMGTKVKDNRIADMVLELPYASNKVVGPQRDVIIPFYFPSNLATINYVYLNLYFPGLQSGDYPSNASIFYIIPIDRGTILYKNGSFDQFESEHHLDPGTMDTGGNYWWNRVFLKYLISPLAGFSLDTCELQWLLYSEAVSGASAKGVELAEVQDFGMVDKNIWGTSVNHDYGTVQSHGDTVGNQYTQDISSRIATLLGAGTKYACYRFRSDNEDTDTSKANFFRYNWPIIKTILSEDTLADVSVYYDNGAGFNLFGSYNSDQENLDLTSNFSGSGKKQLKMTCSKTRRIDVLIRAGITITRS